MASNTAALPLRRIAREQIALAALLVALAVACWWITDRRMDGMAMGPTIELGGVGFFPRGWGVVMAAVVFPAVWPVVGMYERIRAARSVPAVGTAVVVVGYLAAWTACGLVA